MRLPSHEKRPEASAFRSVARKTRVIPFSSSSPYSSSSPPFSFFFFYCIAITRLNYGQAWHARTNGGHRAAYKLLNNAPVPRRRDSTTLKSRLSAATRVFRRVCFQKKKKEKKFRSPLPSCSLPLSRFPMETNSSFHRSRPRRSISRTSGFPFRKILRDTDLDKSLLLLVQRSFSKKIPRGIELKDFFPQTVNEAGINRIWGR